MYLSYMYGLSFLLLALPASWAGVLARILLVISAIISLERNFSRSFFIAKAEYIWLLAGAVYIGGSFLTALFAVKMELAVYDVFRQLYIFLVSFAMLIHFRDCKARMYFVYGLMPYILFSACLIIFGYNSVMGGLASFNFDDSAYFKFQMNQEFGVNTNPLSFAMLLGFILCYSIYKNSYLNIIFVIVAMVALMISGARATIAMLLFGLLFVFFVKDEISRKVFSYAILLIGFLGFLYYINLDEVEKIKYMYEVSDATTGRLELWLAAIAKFYDRPVVGWGASSWDYDLDKYLVLISSDIGRFDILTSGAFHNAYLTVLAEKGLVGFFITASFLFFIYRGSIVVYSERYNMNIFDRKLAAVSPLFISLLVIRGFFEHGGIIGYANASVDFISFAGAALIVALYVPIYQLNSK